MGASDDPVGLPSAPLGVEAPHGWQLLVMCCAVNGTVEARANTDRVVMPSVRMLLYELHSTVESVSGLLSLQRKKSHGLAVLVMVLS